MGYGYYDYGYGGGYYQIPSPGGYLDAEAYLNGPGTHAYVQSGNYSKYASEGQNGSIFEQNTTNYVGGYRQSTSYNYVSSSYHYNSYTLVSYHNPSIYRYSGYGSYYSPYEAGLEKSYDKSAIETQTYGAYRHTASQYATETDFVGGYYNTMYRATSANENNGIRIPGTYTSYSTTSYGYFTDH